MSGNGRTPRTREGLQALATRQAKERILTGARAGVTNKRAAALAGVHESTLYRMRDADPEFAAALETARAERQEHLLAAISRTVDANDPRNSWRAALALLEREYPDEFGPPAQAVRIGPEQAGTDIDVYFAHITGTSPNRSNEEDR